MAVFVRAKRVTGPLGDEVRACLRGEDYRKNGYVSSGSEHQAEDSTFLSDLVHGFLEDESVAKAPEDGEGTDGSDLDLTEMLLPILLNPTVEDLFQAKLLSQVSKAADAFSGMRSNRSAFRRSVMASLRDSGYNAGICKTKWESSGGLAGGNYEFVDVVRSGGERLLIDVDFAAEFEVARPTAQYERLMEVLPRVYVGRTEELKQIVRIMADAAKKSLRSRGLHLPPWRKIRYMQAKWLGPYRRTLVQFPAAAFSSDEETFSVKCRSVGFEAGDGSRFLFPPAGRTRREINQ